MPDKRAINDIRDRYNDALLKKIANAMRSYGIPVPQGVSLQVDNRMQDGVLGLVKYANPKRVHTQPYVMGRARRDDPMAISVLMHELQHTAAAPTTGWWNDESYLGDNELDASAVQMNYLPFIMKAIGMRMPSSGKAFVTRNHGYRTPRDWGGLGVDRFDKGVARMRRERGATLYPGRN